MMKIREFSDIRAGHTFRKRLVEQPKGNVSVIQPKDIQADGAIIFSDGKPLRTKVPFPRPLKQSDVLVVNRGRFAAAVFNFLNKEEWIVPSSIMVLSIREDLILPEYIALYLNSPEGQRIFYKHFEYSTIPFISAQNMASMEIPIPSLDRQRTLIQHMEDARKYKQLTNRKHELFKQFLNHELKDNNINTKGREQ